MGNLIFFKVIGWSSIVLTKEPKLSKKQKKICRILGIPIPPRRVYVSGLMKVDKPENIRTNDGISIEGSHGDVFMVTAPPQNDNEFPVDSVSLLWYFNEPKGTAFVNFHAYGEGTGSPTQSNELTSENK